MTLDSSLYYTIDFLYLFVEWMWLLLIAGNYASLPVPLKDGTNDIIGIWDGQSIRIQLDTDHVWWAGAKAVLRCSARLRPRSFPKDILDILYLLLYAPCMVYYIYLHLSDF